MQRRKITKELCFAIASSCSGKFDLQKKDCYVYKVMLKNGWLEDIFSKTPARPFSWSYENLKEIASKFETKNSFKWGNWNAYHAARRRDFFEDVCSHMKTISVSDEDVLYLLKTNELVKGQTVYKVGISSVRCRKRRLAELKYSSKTSFEVVFWAKTPDARLLETILLDMGTRPEVKNFQGYKEIRMFSDEDLNVVEDLFVGLGVYH